MPIQQNPNKRRGEERSETLIIPHITREMLEVARAMAEKGASRAEIEAALAAMQTGKAPAAPAAPAPEKQPAPGRSDAARSGGIIPTSRPRYTAAERRAMLEEVQRRQAEREAARQAEAQAEEDRFRSYRDREYGRSPAVTPSAAPQPTPAARSNQTPAAADETRTISIPKRRTAEPAEPAAHAVQPPAPAAQPAQQPTQVMPPVQKAAPAAPAAPAPAEHTAHPEPTPAPKSKKASASRSYAAAEAALKDITLSVKKGQKAAVIGGTGSGKSTLVQMLLGFRMPTAGEVRLDGVPTRTLSRRTMRDNISCVLQNATIYSGTIRDNVRMGRLEAGDVEIQEALETAQAGEFVNAFSDGIDHRIRQSGKNLSGGQKQRLSIARALLKNAPIYIFDDSFSALDFLTEAKLRAALNRRLSGKTQLIITQRVTSAMHCDVIFVMDGGALVDSGTHAQLLERCGVYREIYASQTGGNLNA